MISASKDDPLRGSRSSCQPKAGPVRRGQISKRVGVHNIREGL